MTGVRHPQLKRRESPPMVARSAANGPAHRRTKHFNMQSHAKIPLAAALIGTCPLRRNFVAPPPNRETRGRSQRSRTGKVPCPGADSGEREGNPGRPAKRSPRTPVGSLGRCLQPAQTRLGQFTFTALDRPVAEPSRPLRHKDFQPVGSIPCPDTGERGPTPAAPTAPQAASD